MPATRQSHTSSSERKRELTTPNDTLIKHTERQTMRKKLFEKLLGYRFPVTPSKTAWGKTVSKSINTTITKSSAKATISPKWSQKDMAFHLRGTSRMPQNLTEP